jgi:hypothetical protein
MKSPAAAGLRMKITAARGRWEEEDEGGGGKEVAGA